jgi:D-arginine dehydrogenase
LVAQPELRMLVRHGLRFLESPPPPFPGNSGFRRGGSLLLARGKEARELRAWVDADRGVGPEVRFLDPRELKNWIGVTAPETMEVAAFTPSDGVADTHAMLHGFLEGARSGGVEIRFQTRVSDVLTRNGGVEAIRTSSGERIPCSTVVNAAGPWAREIAGAAGVDRIHFATLRRHLVQTELMPSIDPTWPFVWDITHGVYFRPESGGVLLCPCDEEPLEPCDPPLDDVQLEVLAEKVTRYLPGLRGAQIRRSWACIRTFSPDGGAVIGPDPELKGFFWCAALGGHGVGLAPALSELVPDMMLEGRSGILADSEICRISPDRFL